MIILGLGTNLGDRDANLQRAIALIEAKLLCNIRKSSIHKNPAMMPDGAPREWDIEFFNMAISGELREETSPLEFLEELKKIEAKIGRKPTQRWAPREIDIDILAWHEEVFDTENLQIPHIGLHERDFAYKPFLELAPDWLHPRFGAKLGELI